MTEGDQQIWEFTWSPDGREILVLASDEPYEWSWYEPRLARVPAKGGVPKTIYVCPKQMSQPRYSPDGKQVSFITSIMSDRGDGAGDLCVMSVRGGKPRNLTHGYRGSVGDCYWLNAEEILGVAFEEGDAALELFDVKTGECHRQWREPVGVSENMWPRFTRAQNGTVALVRSSPHEPRAVWFGVPSRRSPFIWTKSTNFNANLADFGQGEQEIVHWHSTDGREIQGILIHPAGGSRVPAPLVVVVHGGPTGISSNEFESPRSWAPHLSAHGFAVLMPNYRGSTGWGTNFAEANAGDLGGMDLQDVLTGVQALVDRGVADTERLGIGGWSYGGFMTEWAITQTNRFKSAVAGAGITNWLSFHGNSHLMTWDAQHYGANPYDREGPHQKFSPMNYVSNVTTPTLILQGEMDRDVPAEQAYQYYRALHDHHIPTQLVIYPRELHGISEREHVHDLLTRMIEWFERYLK